MHWILSKPCTMGGGRSVCRQDLGLVNTISLDLDRLSLSGFNDHRRCCGTEWSWRGKYVAM